MTTEMSRVTGPTMLRNNQASAVHIISVLMEDAPYICTICSFSFSGQESTLTKHLLLVLKTKLNLSHLCLYYFLFSMLPTGKTFFKYFLQVLIFRFFYGVYLHKQWKVILIPCSISPGSVKASMFVFLSWRVACLNKI